MQDAVVAGVNTTTFSGKRRRAEFVPSVSPAMMAIERAIANVAVSDVTVLIVGEPGSGKRTLAHILHDLSRRKPRDISEVNCQGLSAESLPAIVGERNGAASAGTVLFTGISDLPSECQPVLLSLLEQKDEAKVGPRLIACSHCSIEQEIRAGRFREDLYYRIAGICMRVPPLRHRHEDISVLAQYFLQKYSLLLGKPEPVLGDSTRKFLAEHSWPGNVTELEAAMKAVAAIGDDRIAIAALRSTFVNESGLMHPESTSLKEAARAASRLAERELILKVLSRTRWNRKRAAEELRISYKALLYKLKQIGVSDYTKLASGGDA